MEVLPFSHAWISRSLAKKYPGCKCKLRDSIRKAGPVVTDNGNFILDVDFGVIEDPIQLERDLLSIPGLLECGIFNKLATEIIIANVDQSISHLSPI